MIAIIDYGAGNLFSVQNALKRIGVESIITSDSEVLISADKLILPGVGAFPDAMRMLRGSGLIEVIQKESKEKPLLGICLGAQILFDKGYEFEETKGLGLIDGYVDKIVAPELKIPHMGWNDVRKINDSPIAIGVSDGSMVYFVHSYKIVTEERNIIFRSEYGQEIPALVNRGKVFGAQFHPEKSGDIGLKILQNFAALE
ncbi:MAG: imidazole glycerol phosphate synthase subunit HisH [Clostridiales Family XIII bacterium]|nr:imidazole glycerol phosphate synthase subunit HisH [Clostridiales Family XIII bacterium]